MGAEEAERHGRGGCFYKKSTKNECPPLEKRVSRTALGSSIGETQFAKRAFDDVAVELLRRAGKEGTTRNLDGDDVTSAQNLF